MDAGLILCLVIFISGFPGSPADGANDIPTNGPTHTDVLLGGEAVLTCKTAYTHRYCSFVHQGSSQSYSLDADIPGYLDGTVLYEGDNDPDKRTCGMRITKVTENMNGEWRCEITAIIDGKIRQGRGYANITVIRKPTDIVMDVNGVKDGEFKVKYPSDENEKVTCTAIGGRPAPTFKWMLGEKEIEGLDQAVTNSTTVYPDGTTDYSQTITFKAVQKHNGKSVSCMAVQKGYSEDDMKNGLNKVSKIMDVSFKPVSALNDFSFYGMVTGKPGNIKISFLSHPRPTSVEWIMHDQGGKPVMAPSESLDTRYTAKPITEGPTEGYYTAELKIQEIQKKDSETTNQLIVRNDLGATTYSFTIGIGELPPSEKAQSSMTGVIVAIVVIALIILLVCIAAKYYNLCCWAASSDAQDMDDIEKAAQKEGGEGSDTESADNDVKDGAKKDTETDGDAENQIRKSPTKSVTDRMTGLLTAMKKSVGGKKEKYSEEGDEKLQEEDESKEGMETKKEDNVVYADLDKSAMSEGKPSTLNSEPEKTEYAEITPQQTKE